jgi:hypothetical protein
MDACFEHLSLPRSTTNTTVEPVAFADDGLIAALLTNEDPTRPGRLVIRNHGKRALVFTPDAPHTEGTTPVFTSYGTTATAVGIGYPRRVVDAVQRHLGLRGNGCLYSIKHEAFQVVGDSPERFLRDIERVLVYQTTHPLEERGEGQPPSQLVTAAACWPVEHGWFYLEGELHFGTSKSYWTYGLLSASPLVDPTRLEPFFSACGESVPALAWELPERTVRATPEAFLRRLDGTQIHRGFAQCPMLLSGSNPLYGVTEPEGCTLDAFDRLDLYDSLAMTERLVYRPTTMIEEGQPVSIRHIRTVEPPTLRSLFVEAVVDPLY